MESVRTHRSQIWVLWILLYLSIQPFKIHFMIIVPSKYRSHDVSFHSLLLYLNFTISLKVTLVSTAVTCIRKHLGSNLGLGIGNTEWVLVSHSYCSRVPAKLLQIHLIPDYPMLIIHLHLLAPLNSTSVINKASWSNLCVTFHNELFIYGGELLDPLLTLQPGGSPFAGCLRLLIQ